MDKNSEEWLISESIRWGFQFYKRVRLKEYQVQITARQNITEYPGLVAISKEPAIKFNVISRKSSTHTDWGPMLWESIELTLLNLIINGFVELTVFADRKFFLSGLIKYNSGGYYLTTSKTYSGKDYLSSCIVKSIKAVEEKYPRKKNLSLFVTHLIDEQIGIEDYHRPERQFLATFLNGYNDNAPLAFQNHSIFLGEYSRFEVVFTPKQKTELIAAYYDLSKIYKSLKLQSKHFKEYSIKLHRHIRADFNGRLPGD